MTLYSIEIEYCYSVLVLELLLLFKFFFPLIKMRELSWREMIFCNEKLPSKVAQSSGIFRKMFHSLPVHRFENPELELLTICFPFHC